MSLLSSPESTLAAARANPELLATLGRGFACPQEPLDSGFQLAVTRDRSVRLVRLFHKAFRRRLERTEGVTELLTRFGEEPLGFGAVWNLAFGRLRSAIVKNTDAGCFVAAAELCLHLAGCGIPASFTVALASPTRLRFGLHQLPRTTHLVFAGDHERAQIQLKLESGEARTLSFSRLGGRWISQEAMPLPTLETPAGPVVVLSGIDHPELVPELKTASPIVDKEVTRDILAAYQVIERFAPTYLPWVGRMVQVLIPIEAAPGRSESYSDDLLPGVVGLSRGSSVLRLAEMLVHEAAHQYFHNITSLGRVDDGSDTAQYYSPVRGMNRPIEMILVAYHAFANVLFFYKLCMPNGIPEVEQCRIEEAQTLPQLAELALPLHQSRALTPIGRSLFQPLDERISQRE